jgi:3'-5' exoribonuclease
MSRLPKVRELAHDSEGWGYFLCVHKELRAVRSGEILLFTLQDDTGHIPAKLVDDVERFREEFEAGEFVRVEARATTFQGQLQLAVTHVRRVHAAQDRLHGFREEECVLSAARSVDEMWDELKQHVQSVGNAHVRVLLNRMLTDHEPELRLWPAGRSVHHAYRAGLLEHTLKVVEVARAIARAYGANEDLVIAGAVLHDVGKLQELQYEPGGASYTRDGNLIGHIALGVIMIREAIAAISGFPDDLRAQIEHLVIAHHGARERGSPVEPRTVEAFIVAAVDELDTRVHQVRRAVAEDTGTDEFTAWHKRLGRVLYKGPGAP